MKITYENHKGFTNVEGNTPLKAAMRRAVYAAA